MTPLAKAHLSLIAMFGVAAVLFFFPPELYHFYPQCPVFRYLHIYCPGCGATRAVAALLHGHWKLALHYNALVTFLTPAALYFLAKTYIRILRGQSFPWPRLSPAATTLLLFAAFLFAIVRNAATHFAF